MLCGAISASIARPNLQAIRTASAFSTGRVPGMPRSTRLAWVLGSAPKVVALPEKIFDWVLSCAWISSPITVSHCICSISSESGRGAQVPVADLLILVRHVEQARLLEVWGEQLHAHRQAVDEAGRHRQARYAREIGGDGVD